MHLPDFEEQRALMVERQLRARGVTDTLVLEAMASVARELFVPPSLAEYAYQDGPLPIGEGQTISQPYIVAQMSELACVRPGQRVLEVGTGSGYQAAVLSLIAAEVYTVERVPSLVAGAQELLSELGYENVHARLGDGTLGWPEAAPFDAILVTAGAPKVPHALADQLKSGGRLVLPVGEGLAQLLVRVTKDANGVLHTEQFEPVAFVPLIGEQGW